MKTRIKFKITPTDKLKPITNLDLKKITAINIDYYPNQNRLNKQEYNAFNNRHLKYKIRVTDPIYNNLKRLSKELNCDWLKHGKRSFGFGGNNTIVCLW